MLPWGNKLYEVRWPFGRTVTDAAAALPARSRDGGFGAPISARSGRARVASENVRAREANEVGAGGAEVGAGTKAVELARRFLRERGGGISSGFRG